jgi:hypothetical protein
MPLFKSKSERLFDAVVDRAGVRLSELKRAALSAADPSLPQDSLRRQATADTSIVISTIAGGAGGARFAVEGIGTLKKLWGKGDDGKAAGLTEVFCLPTLSYLLNFIDAQNPAARVKEKSRNLIAGIARALYWEQTSEVDLEFFDQLDRQIRYEYWERQAVPDAVFFGYAGYIVFSEALDALGGKPPIQGDLGTFPIADPLEFMSRSCIRDKAPLMDLHNISGMQGSFHVAFNTAKHAFIESAVEVYRNR